MSYDKTKHDAKYLVITLLTAFVWSVKIAFVPLQSTIYSVPVFSIANLVKTDIAPASWVFSLVWNSIYVWNSLWVVYAVFNLFRTCQNGQKFYRLFDVFSLPLMIAFAIGNCFLLAWSPAYLNGQRWIAFPLLVLTWWSVTFSLWWSLRQFSRSLTDKMTDARFQVDLWLSRLVFHNGIAIFATWSTLASILSFNSLFISKVGVDSELTGTISLSVILALACVYSFMENVLFTRALLHQFSPWIVLNLASVAIVQRNWIVEKPSRNNILALVVLCASALLSLAKIASYALHNTVFHYRVASSSSPKRPSTTNNYVST